MGNLSRGIAMIEMPRQGVAEVSGGKANHRSEMRGHGNDYRSVGEAQSSRKQQRLRSDRPGLLWHCTNKRSEGKAVTGIDVPGQGIERQWISEDRHCQGRTVYRYAKALLGRVRRVRAREKRNISKRWHSVAEAKQDRETLRRGVEPHENAKRRNCLYTQWRGPVKHGGGIAQIGMAEATDRIDVSCNAMA